MTHSQHPITFQFIMSAFPKYLPHYTLADYALWQGDWELWQGVPVAMTPSPFGRHQWIAGQIMRQFLNSLDATCEDCFVLMETDWIVAEDTVVRPDIVIVCGAFPERHIVEPPRLSSKFFRPPLRTRIELRKWTCTLLSRLCFICWSTRLDNASKHFKETRIPASLLRCRLRTRWRSNWSQTA